MDAPAWDSVIELVDAHCHVDLFGKQEDSVLDAVERRGVHTIAVTNVPSVFFHTRDKSRGKRFLYPAIGLHPELATSHGHELDMMWPCLTETRFVGEVGLDYVITDQDCRRQQRNVFSRIISKGAELGDRVITVHSRRAASDVLSAIGSAFPGTIILHWFSGTRRELERAIELGCWFSVNPAMLRSLAGRALVTLMPRDRVLTETDGPFVTVEGRPATPDRVEVAVQRLAQLWGEAPDETARRVLESFQRAIGSRR